MYRALPSRPLFAHPLKGQARRLVSRVSVGFFMLVIATAAIGCETDASNNTGNTGPRIIQLAVDQGVVFTVGEVVPGASYLKVDLVCRKHGSTNFDLKAGGSGPSEIMYMNTFKNGGVRKKFASLSDIPPTLPGTSNFGEFVNTVKTGDGFVIANNIGDGHTKVWVKRVLSTSGLVELEYEAIPK